MDPKLFRATSRSLHQGIASTDYRNRTIVQNVEADADLAGSSIQGLADSLSRQTAA